LDSLVVSFNAVAPIFLMVSLGYCLKLRRILDRQTLAVMNGLCFGIFLPLLLFINIYHTEISTIFNRELIIFVIASILVTFLLVSLLIPLFEKDSSRRGVMIQGIFRSNFVILGIPLSAAVYGADSVGLTAMLIAIIVPLYNVLAVTTLVMHSSGKMEFRKVAIGILRNPLIIATLLGLSFLLLGIQLPVFVESAISDMAKIAAPLSIIVLGGSFEFSRISGNKRTIAMGVLGRLVVVPAFLLGAAILCGFRGMTLMVLIAAFATPTAISSFVMAQNMGGDGELAGHLVVFSSLFSCVTLFLWIFLLRFYHFI